MKCYCFGRNYCYCKFDGVRYCQIPHYRLRLGHRSFVQKILELLLHIGLLLLLGNNWFTWTITNGPCPSSTDSMVVFIRDCLTINIPNAYSPNGDGVNDVFRITNVDSYPQSSFQVFNRWGSKVLDQSPYANDWDGRNQFGSAFGELLPESTYYYILDLGDGSEAYTGYIYLRR